ALCLMVQASSYGQTIPVILGRTRSPIYLIWSNNLRQGDSNKKGKKGKKGSPPNYIENADFILGWNPIAAVLRIWQNATEIPLTNQGKFSAPLPGALAPPVITVPDPNFYAVLGVTATMPYSFDIDDYGGQGPQTLTGTYERPLWNSAYAGPDPTNASSYRNAPFVYTWVPGSGPSIRLPFTAQLSPYTAFTYGITAINVYYAAIHDIPPLGVKSPLAVMRLEFEPELGSGSEYAGFEGERIRYQSYAGVGSDRLDLGAGQMIPDLKPEILGAYPIYPTADCDFVDMVEHVIEQGQQQCSPSGAATAASTPLQSGLNCWDFPAPVQKKYLWNLEYFQSPGPVAFERIVTKGNMLVAAVNSGLHFGPAPSTLLGDTQGNAWTQVFPTPPPTPSSNGGLNLWYAIANATGPNTVNFTGIGSEADVELLEIGGVDTVDVAEFKSGVSTSGQTSDSLDITTTGAPGRPAYLFAFGAITAGYWIEPGGNPLWKNLMPRARAQNGSGAPPVAGGNPAYHGGPRWSFLQQAIIRNPRTYNFSVQIGGQINPAGPPTTIPPGVGYAMAVIAFKNSQPVPWTKALGSIVDTESVEIVRQQCRAYGLWGSQSMDSQKKGSDWLEDFAFAGNYEYVWSGFKLKLVARAEQSFAGNGANYTAPTASGPLMDLDRRHFIGDPTTPMITVDRKDPVDADNVIQIEHINRPRYQPIVTSQPDNAAIAKYGIRKAEPKVLNCIQAVGVARNVAGILVRRAQNTLNTFSFTMKANFDWLEAMDLVTVTDELLGIYKQPVRFISIKQTKDLALQCVAEPFVYGANVPVDLPVTENQGHVTDQGADPGPVNPPFILLAVPQLNQGQSGNYIKIALSGRNQNWGGAVIYASADGTAYKPVGERIGESTMGLLTADWPSGTSPDTVNDLSVDLSESYGELSTHSTIEEDNFVSIFAVEGGDDCVQYELGSYAVADLTGPNAYDISASGGNYIRRGAYGTPIGDHPAGSKFALMDQNVATILVDPTWLGKTIFFKFTSFNKLQGNVQSLADVVAYPFTLPAACFHTIVGFAPLDDLEVDIVAPTPLPAGGMLTIPHSLGTTPKLVLIQMTSDGNVWFQTPLRYDASNIYVVASDAGVTAKAILWSNPPGAEIALAPAAAGDFQIPNTLGSSPAMLSVQMTSDGFIWNKELDSDSNFIYFAASDAGVTGFLEAWPVGAPATGPINTNFVEIPFGPTTAGPFTIVHGLGVTPNVALIRMKSAGRVWFQTARYDDTNIYLVASDDGLDGVLEVLYGGQSQSGQPVPNVLGGPSGVEPSGTIDGTTGSDGNPTQTVAVASAPKLFILFKNGQAMDEGVAFDSSWTAGVLTITWLAPYIPVTGDTTRAVILF
ncbi:MAG: phage tail protein, partial [Mycobacteriales bacterium]